MKYIFLIPSHIEYSYIYYLINRYYPSLLLSNKIYFIDNPGSGTFYYAITSEEHSGLESDELSEILMVTVSGSNVVSQIVASKGQKNFWRIPPAKPTNFNVLNIRPGHYQLNWSEPNDSKIRYYNIYYSNSSNPSPIQQRRIASVPVGTSSYLDWLADPVNLAYYGITSVDRYGNESAIVFFSTNDKNPPAPPIGVKVE